MGRARRRHVGEPVVPIEANLSGVKTTRESALTLGVFVALETEHRQIARVVIRRVLVNMVNLYRASRRPVDTACPIGRKRTAADTEAGIGVRAFAISESVRCPPRLDARTNTARRGDAPPAPHALAPARSPSRLPRSSAASTVPEDRRPQSAFETRGRL